MILYDDMMTKQKTASDNEEIAPHLIIYTIVGTQNWNYIQRQLKTFLTNSIIINQWFYSTKITIHQIHSIISDKYAHAGAHTHIQARAHTCTHTQIINAQSARTNCLRNIAIFRSSNRKFLILEGRKFL